MRTLPILSLNTAFC